VKLGYSTTQQGKMDLFNGRRGGSISLKLKMELVKLIVENVHVIICVLLIVQ
jgi:hypothetical protein